MHETTSREMERNGEKNKVNSNLQNNNEARFLLPPKNCLRSS